MSNQQSNKKVNTLPNLPKVSIFDKQKNRNTFTSSLSKSAGPQNQTKVSVPPVRITQNKGGS